MKEISISRSIRLRNLEQLTITVKEDFTNYDEQTIQNALDSANYYIDKWVERRLRT